MFPMFDSTCPEEPLNQEIDGCPVEAGGTGVNQWYHIPYFLAFQFSSPQGCLHQWRLQRRVLCSQCEGMHQGRFRSPRRGRYRGRAVPRRWVSARNQLGRAARSADGAGLRSGLGRSRVGGRGAENEARHRQALVALCRPPPPRASLLHRTDNRPSDIGSARYLSVLSAGHWERALDCTALGYLAPARGAA